MHHFPLRAVAALVGFALLAGCGGGSGTPDSSQTPGGAAVPGGGQSPGGTQARGGGPQTPPVPQFAPSPQIPPGPDDAAFSATKGEYVATFYSLSQAGTLAEDVFLINFETLEVFLRRVSGTLASDRSQMAFGTQVVALSDPVGLDYLRLYNASGRPGGDLGLYGFQTLETAMPGGSASYLGRAEVFATDANRIYTLAGEAIVDADFAGQTVTVRFVGLEGQAQGLSGGGLAATQVPGGGEIRLSGAAISGSSFGGGTPAVFGTPFAVEGALRDTGSIGGFFGPGADEAGGLVAIDDAGSLRIRGRYVAD
jgi:hypothetical protein